MLAFDCYIKGYKITPLRPENADEKEKTLLGLIFTAEILYNAHIFNWKFLLKSVCTNYTCTKRFGISLCSLPPPLYCLCAWIPCRRSMWEQPQKAGDRAADVPFLRPFTAFLHVPMSRRGFAPWRQSFPGSYWRKNFVLSVHPWNTSPILWERNPSALTLH